MTNSGKKKKENWSERFLLNLDHILYHRTHFIRDVLRALQAVLAIIISLLILNAGDNIGDDQHDD